MMFAVCGVVTRQQKEQMYENNILQLIDYSIAMHDKKQSTRLASKLSQSLQC